MGKNPKKFITNLYVMCSNPAEACILFYFSKNNLNIFSDFDFLIFFFYFIILKRWKNRPTQSLQKLCNFAAISEKKTYKFLTVAFEVLRFLTLSFTIYHLQSFRVSYFHCPRMGNPHIKEITYIHHRMYICLVGNKKVWFSF